MKIKTILIAITICLCLTTCKKETSSPSPQPATGSITFWSSHDAGCGPITVTLDGKNVGQITNWQAFAPSNCNQSNTLLVVTTTQGNHSVSFKHNCKTWSATINLTSACYIHQAN